MTKLSVVLVVLCGASVAAFADGRLSGRVTDRNDQPVGGASVIVTGPDGAEAVVTTDPTGRYVATVPAGGAYTVVFAFGKAKLGAHVDIPADGAAQLDSKLEMGGEIIEVHSHRPVQYAKPKADPLLIPPYSDAAALGDTWSRAWLLLDVNDHGVVDRLKFLKRPGHDLDDIAVKYAFDLRFDPARDGRGVPTRSYVVWPLEWPALGWLLSRQSLAIRLPQFPEVVQAPHGIFVDMYPPCQGEQGLPLSSLYPMLRDCSVPDLSRGDASEPWLVRDSRVPPPVVAAAPILDPAKLRADQIALARQNRTSAIIATAITGAMVVGVAASYWQFSKYHDRVNADEADHTTFHPDRLASDRDRQRNWGYGMLGFMTGTLISGLATDYFWAHSSLTLQPSAEGASVSYAGRF
jgi:hypothetical protein